MIFKPEDFPNVLSREMTEIADLANAKLAALIEQATVVYSYNGKDDWFIPTTQDYPNVTHKSRLMFIEEIKREPCQHEPQIRYDGTQTKENPFYYEPMGFWCKHCFVVLEAAWSEVK